IAQVLEDVRQHNRLRVVRKPPHGFEIGDDCLIEMAPQIADAIDVVFESDRALESAAQRLAQLAAGGAQVEERVGSVGETADEIDEDAVGAALEILECVDVRHQYSDHGLPLGSVPGALLRTSTMPLSTRGSAFRNSSRRTGASVIVRQSAACVTGSFGITWR